MATDEPQGAGVYVAPIDEHPKKSNMAKEIVIPQRDGCELQLYFGTSSILEIHQRIKDGTETISIDKSDTPRLISALCELSGVSGVPTAEEIQNTVFDHPKCMDEEIPSATAVELLKDMRDKYTPIIARLQAENATLREEKQKVLSAVAKGEDVYAAIRWEEADKSEFEKLQAENEELKKRLIKDQKSLLDIQSKYHDLLSASGNTISLLSASQEATEGAFAEWASKNNWDYSSIAQTWINADNSQTLTTAELLADFRKETGK